MADETCGLLHHQWPESRCTEPAGRHDRDEGGVIHAGPWIVGGRKCGAVVWSEPKPGG